MGDPEDWRDVLTWAYIRKRYWENEMLAGQIVGMIGKVLTTEKGQEQPKNTQPKQPRKKKDLEKLLKRKGFGIR